jgi:hypothetical protein
MNLVAVYIFSVIGCQAVFKAFFEPMLYKLWYGKTDRIKYNEWLSVISYFKAMSWMPFVNTMFLAVFGYFFILFNRRGKF